MNKSTVALFVVFVSKRLLICCEEFGFTGNSNCNLHLFYLESGTVDCAYVGKITSAHWLNKQVQPFCCVPEYLNWMAPQSEAVLFPTDSKKQALFYISGTSWSGKPHQHSANANSKFKHANITRCFVRKVVILARKLKEDPKWKVNILEGFESSWHYSL